jgi:hypothetical protein
MKRLLFALLLMSGCAKPVVVAPPHHPDASVSYKLHIENKTRTVVYVGIFENNCAGEIRGQMAVPAGYPFYTEATQQLTVPDKRPIAVCFTAKPGSEWVPEISDVTASLNLMVPGH